MRIVTAEQKQAEAEAAALELRKAEARTYLAATDWYITRRAETQKSVPREILDKRAAARETLSE